MRERKIGLVGAVVAVGVLVAGCGGAGTTSAAVGTTSAAPSTPAAATTTTPAPVPTTTTVAPPAPSTTLGGVGRSVGTPAQQQRLTDTLNTINARRGAPAFTTSRTVEYAGALCDLVGSSSFRETLTYLIDEINFVPEDATVFLGLSVATRCPELTPTS